MTLIEWTNTIVAELREAGFDVFLYQGFPVAKLPIHMDGIVLLLKFRTSFACDRRIYGEGMLFIPAGLWDAEEKKRLESRARPHMASE